MKSMLRRGFMFNKMTIDDINVSGKKVLVRCDFNVPMKDGVITDDKRITASLPTLQKLIKDGGKLILCSHMGKPKGEPLPELSLAPVASRLSELLGISSLSFHSPTPFLYRFQILGKDRLPPFPLPLTWRCPVLHLPL